MESRAEGEADLERGTKEGDSPVDVKQLTPVGILSITGPEKSCENRPAPSGKAKYSSMTDSEPVP